MAAVIVIVTLTVRVARHRSRSARSRSRCRAPELLKILSASFAPAQLALSLQRNPDPFSGTENGNANAERADRVTGEPLGRGRFLPLRFTRGQKTASTKELSNEHHNL